jgi:hypothetical protein
MSTVIDEARAGHHQHGHHHEEHGHDHCVTIHVNNMEVFLNAGKYAVATIKKLAAVPLADDLDQLVDCELKPLADDGHVHIHGCEVFISHVKDGGSS